MNEQHRNVNPNENFSPPRQAEPFVSQSRTKPRYNERAKERYENKRPRLECTYNGKSNHDQSTCRRRLNAEAGIAEEQCSYCHNYGHPLPACRKKANDYYTENKIKSSKAALSHTREEFRMEADTNSLDRHGWYADSGATHHVCGDISMMNNYIAIPPKSWSVNGIGAIRVYAHGQGDVSINCNLEQCPLCPRIVDKSPIHRLRNTSRYWSWIFWSNGSIQTKRCPNHEQTSQRKDALQTKHKLNQEVDTGQLNSAVGVREQSLAEYLASAAFSH